MKLRNVKKRSLLLSQFSALLVLFSCMFFVFPKHPKSEGSTVSRNGNAEIITEFENKWSPVLFRSAHIKEVTLRFNVAECRLIEVAKIDASECETEDRWIEQRLSFPLDMILARPYRTVDYEDRVRIVFELSDAHFSQSLRNSEQYSSMILKAREKEPSIFDAIISASDQYILQNPKYMDFGAREQLYCFGGKSVHPLRVGEFNVTLLAHEDANEFMSALTRINSFCK